MVSLLEVSEVVLKEIRGWKSGLVGVEACGVRRRERKVSEKMKSDERRGGGGGGIVAEQRRRV